MYIFEDVYELSSVEARAGETKRLVGLEVIEKILWARLHDKVKPIRVLESSRVSFQARNREDGTNRWSGYIPQERAVIRCCDGLVVE